MLHGIAKLQTGVAGISSNLANAGFPGAVAYLVYVGEVVAPILLIVGLWTRPAALIVAINMVVAILLVHAGQILSLSKSGGWAIELQAIYLFAALRQESQRDLRGVAKQCLADKVTAFIFDGNN